MRLSEDKPISKASNPSEFHEVDAIMRLYILKTIYFNKPGVVKRCKTGYCKISVLRPKIVTSTF